MFKTNHQRFLKVKIKSLAAESKIIRLEERKTRYVDTEGISYCLREELYQHRVGDVRQETRSALLAYAYLRGRSLCSTEKTSTRKDYTTYSVDHRAHKIVKKFGTKEAYDNFQSWLYAMV